MVTRAIGPLLYGLQSMFISITSIPRRVLTGSFVMVTSIHTCFLGRDAKVELADGSKKTWEEVSTPAILCIS